MNRTILMTLAATGCLCIQGCTQEKEGKDRGDAREMYERICKLTNDYTRKLHTATDSISWATDCSEYEEKLDKIVFSYPPDTDLLLTEGQNDTLYSLMKEYEKTRDDRIHNILHPVAVPDTVLLTDGKNMEAKPIKTVNVRQDASHSRGN